MTTLMSPERLRALADVRVSAPGGLDLRELRQRAGLTLDQAGAWLGRHRTSLVRMERGQTRAGLAAVHLLAVLGGVLPYAPWTGWRMTAGALVSPHDGRLSYTPGELDLVTFAWQSAQAARAELRRLGVPEAEVRRRLPQYREAA